jgi:hypothetical protein
MTNQPTNYELRYGALQSSLNPDMTETIIHRRVKDSLESIGCHNRMSLSSHKLNPVSNKQITVQNLTI